MPFRTHAPHLDCTVWRVALSVCLLPIMSFAANYAVQTVPVHGIEVVRLQDARNKIEVSIAPSIGNNAYEMKVNGKPIFWAAYSSLSELRDKPTMMGNPFLAPWANRIAGDGYYANGKRYLLNDGLKNFRRDGHGQPIHGLVTYAKDWRVVDMKADEDKAEVTSRLEFWRHPDWMAQFPFAHTMEMTYRLQNGMLEVETRLHNESLDPMPVSVAFHTYYALPDTPRDEWKVTIPARDRVVLNEKLTPTGERQPNPYTEPVTLRGLSLDDVFTNLVHTESGRTEFVLQGRQERIAVLYGPKYPVSVIYSPKDKSFLCFEPMTGVTNAFNLMQEGKEQGLQMIAPGQTWKESFWIKPSGF